MFSSFTAEPNKWSGSAKGICMACDNHLQALNQACISLLRFDEVEELLRGRGELGRATQKEVLHAKLGILKLVTSKATATPSHNKDNVVSIYDLHRRIGDARRGCIARKIIQQAASRQASFDLREHTETSSYCKSIASAHGPRQGELPPRPSVLGTRCLHRDLLVACAPTARTARGASRRHR
eukprot:6207378-Pleurochrysis_carterae.AAC.2